MKSLIKILQILPLLILTYCSQSQNVADAVRWSYTNPGGTARTLGVGGSFGAMGGDFSVVNINPAGIAAYKKGEFTISPSLSNQSSTAYLTTDINKITRKKYNAFSLDNAGLVFAGAKRKSAFAIGFSKIADLNKNFTYSGKSTGSITQRFEEQANGKTVSQLDDFEGYAAYATGAIFDPDSNTYYDTDFSSTEDVAKTQQVEQKGYIHELSIAWAKNISENFMFGLSAGIPFVSYEEIKSYEETDPSNTNPTFNSLQYTEYLNTSGSGINVKAGFIYKPFKSLRLGGAIHSPTYYVLNDDYYTALEYSYNDGQDRSYDYKSPDGNFKYRLNTPFKAIGSIGTIYNIGKIKGFVNGDVEWIDYNVNKFDFGVYSDDKSEDLYTIEVNNSIEKYLGSALNIRLGTELAYDKIRLRFGIESGDDPVSANSKKISTTSFGIGIREDNYFIDLGIRSRKYTEGYVPYVLIDPTKETLVNNQFNFNKIVVTAGFKF